MPDTDGDFADRDDSHWDDSHWDDPDWDGAVPAITRRPPARPWYRSPGLLLGLIGAASAVLVVATAILVSGTYSGEIPQSRRLDTRSSAPSSSVSAPASPEQTPSSTPTSTPTTTSAPPSSSESPPDPPDEPAPPPAPVPAPEPESGPAPKGSAGPKINVTRTPMSFTPGGSARP